MKPFLCYALIAVTTIGCSTRSPSVFQPPDLTAHSASPWTHLDFDDDPAGFTFGVFSDLTGGERERIFEVAVEQLNLLRPEFVIGVGDLIDGGTEDTAELHAQWRSFEERAGRVRAPLFFVGGNHDLTNATLRDVWAERHGPRYYHFVYRDVLFLVLDTDDHSPERLQEISDLRALSIAVMESDTSDRVVDTEYYRMPERRTGDMGPDQAAYALDVLARYPDVRWTFLFMHKPIWLKEEPEPEFDAIEEALSTRPYTLFNGHYHLFSHAVHRGRDHTMLGTTGGGQGQSPMAFDHVSLVTMTDEGPVWAHLRMDAVLGKDGNVPAGGDTLCFQASRC